ncbi:SLC13 family permease [Marinobacterium mangrovicola]|uniref:Di/tricarboxylate transporter n=1 Tax=Marinobacterium mangrovicola TaxID=1476959 RepID=A0A4R1GJE6_9GAMM|nr:SLC13 family permease [Marinobacterium mangrovicola]TCK07263.1 di/tricarboxylate transporter [Marinobacterium mangrovicola]
MEWGVLASVVALLAVLASGRIQPATAFVTLACGYLLTGLVDLPELLGSFANPALATLILLLLISLTLERSPLLDQISDKIVSGRQSSALLKLMTTSAVLSAFLNNTAIVASFLGTLSRQTRIPASRLLIPLSYASILGGITTLVGTSTNLVVSSFAVDAGIPELSMFQFSLVGIPVALVCLGALMLSARYLPNNSNTSRDSRQSYFLTTEVAPDSPLVGKSIEANAMRNLDGLYLLEIERDGRLISPVTPDEVVQARDLLIFTGEVNKVQALQRFQGLKLMGEDADDLLASNLVEVVISNESELANRTLQDMDFRTTFNAGVVGIRRGERRLEGQLGRIPLRVGDSLLLAVGGDFSQHRNLDRNFHLLSGTLQRPRLSMKQSLTALGGFAAAILSASLGITTLFEALLCLLGLFLLGGLLSVNEMRRRFPFELFLVIGSALTIAKGMSASGAAGLVAEGMQALFNGYGVYAAFVGIFLLTLVLTETVTNNAAAALAFPIALSTAQAFNADPMPFIMAVAYGASACFLIPFGYQTHLMVYSPGRYRLSDYLKTGLPVSLVYTATVLTLTPLVFPFNAS